MHSLLQAAHEAAPEADRPPPPYHGGVDANPQLGSFGLCGVALFVAESISARVTKAERDHYAHWLELAQDVYARHARGETKAVASGSKTKLRALTEKALRVLQREAMVKSQIPGPEPEPSPAIIAARAALVAAYDVEVQLGGSYVLAAIREAIKHVVPALPPQDVRSFLIALDRRLLREELRAMVERRRDPRCAEIEACVWRAAGEKKSRQGRAAGQQLTHWIGRLKDDSYVLVWKVGSRWVVTEGSRDEVLATVPDAHMESAVKGVIAAQKAAARELTR